MIYLLNFFLVSALLIAFNIRFIEMSHRFIFSGILLLTIFSYNAIPYVDRSLTDLIFIARQLESEEQGIGLKIDEQILREVGIGVLGGEIDSFDNVIKLSFPSRLNFLTQYNVSAAYFVDKR